MAPCPGMMKAFIGGRFTDVIHRMWKPHATAEDEDGQIWRAPAGEGTQSLDPGAQPGAWSSCSHSGVVLFGKPCQGSRISGFFFPLGEAQGGWQGRSPGDTNQLPTPSSPSLQLRGFGSPWERLPWPFCQCRAVSRGAGGCGCGLPLVLKAKLQYLQTYGLTSVCVRMCFFSMLGFLQRIPHSSQTYFPLPRPRTYTYSSFDLYL